MIPETTVGGGDKAYLIDYTHDGLTRSWCLTAVFPMGPIQLLTPQPPAPVAWCRTALPYRYENLNST